MKTLTIGLTMMLMSVSATASNGKDHTFTPEHYDTARTIQQSHGTAPDIASCTVFTVVFLKECTGTDLSPNSIVASGEINTFIKRCEDLKRDHPGEFLMLQFAWKANRYLPCH